MKLDIVWISDDLNAPVMSGDGPKRGHWGSVKSQVFRNGPYVHLEQFMDEVLAEARACADAGFSFDASFTDLVQDMAKELLERKEP